MNAGQALRVELALDWEQKTYQVLSWKVYHQEDYEIDQSIPVWVAIKAGGVPMFTEDVLRNAVEQGAADIFLIPGMPLSWKVGGKIIYQTDEKIFPKEIEEMVREIYALAKTAAWIMSWNAAMTTLQWHFRAFPVSVSMYSAREVHWLLLSV